MAWTIEQALRSRYVDNVFVSTESTEIAEIAKQFGANIPFLRPSELAADDSPISEAIMHVLDKYEDMQEKYDYVVLLEPTSPLRKPNDIDEAIQLLIKNSQADSLVSVGEVHMEHPMIVKKIDRNGFVVPYIGDVGAIYQRQQADKAYFPYGVIYTSKIPSYREKRTFYTNKTVPYFIERWQNFEVDDEIDFIIIEKIMALKMEGING